MSPQDMDAANMVLVSPPPDKLTVVMKDFATSPRNTMKLWLPQRTQKGFAFSYKTFLSS
jgi:hypothetical protein